MKTIRLLPLLFIAAMAVSCSPVRVAADYDEGTDFSHYKTYGFLKDGVDKAEISDLDKKRIMRAIDTELAKKGLSKSDKPDVLVNFFTKADKNVNITNWGGYYGMGMGYGWGGYGWGGGWGYGYGGYPRTSISTYVEGTLFIDLIDSGKKELVWQGIGNGVLTNNHKKKQERINEFVNKIIAEFPPKKDK